MLQNKDAILEELLDTFKADILDIHEFHLWCLVPPTTFATLHVIFRDESVSNDVTYRVYPRFRP